MTEWPGQLLYRWTKRDMLDGLAYLKAQMGAPPSGISGLTTGTIPKAGSATSLTDSLLSESAEGVAITGLPSNLTLLSSVASTLGNAGDLSGDTLTGAYISAVHATGSDIEAVYGLSVNAEFNSNGAFSDDELIGGLFNSNLNSTTNDLTTTAIRAIARNFGSAGTGHEIRGGSFEAITDNVGTAVGIRTLVANSVGSGNWTGIGALIRSDSAYGESATLTGVLVQTATTAVGGTISSFTGLKIEDQTAAAINYAIYTGAGLVRLGGLPTSSAGLDAGTLWNNSGAVRVA
jgi:hypothetical protein